ncbi:hypothetical protein [Alkalicoccus daliensis]|uniref:Uncharacterized protein n=1 Tax=Alkalicoccus daliensis TaxID=745820 RepID=A0A1H0CV95_9BACI|nr:hypothetical protein [Alkalicoccus daliensis]SDN61611.1 hypothetical protein SAMN04488053_102238 [Alkalicoccus daliensis]
MKKLIIPGILICTTLFAGCSGENNEVEVKAEAVQVEGEEEAQHLLSVLKNNILQSIAEETELAAEDIDIMVSSGIDEGQMELSCSLGLPAEANMEKDKLEQIVVDTMESVAEAENVAVSEENITVLIEKH